MGGAQDARGDDARIGTLGDTEGIRNRRAVGGGGAVIGALPDGRLLRDNGPEHVACIAPTRPGKGVGQIIPRPRMLAVPSDQFSFSITVVSSGMSGLERVRSAI